MVTGRVNLIVPAIPFPAETASRHGILVDRVLHCVTGLYRVAEDQCTQVLAAMPGQHVSEGHELVPCGGFKHVLYVRQRSVKRKDNKQKRSEKNLGEKYTLKYVA